MTVCPIAIISGCAKCPAFKLCPLKSVLGDQATPPTRDTPNKEQRNAKK